MMCFQELKMQKATCKQSIQNEPKVQEYIKIDIKYLTGINTLFIYVNKKDQYIEQHYQGIHEIDYYPHKKLQYNMYYVKKSGI